MNQASAQPPGPDELPAPVRAAWGVADRPVRGPKPGLSVARIVAAGMAVADADGLAAVSMSRVAGRLGAATMSLYRHVPAKEDLLTLMMDAAVGPPPKIGPDEDWRAGLRRWAVAMLAGFFEHPWVVSIPLRGLPTMPNEVAWTEAALYAMRDNGLTAAERLSVLMLIAGYVRNQVLMQLQIAAAFARHDSPDAAMADYARTLGRLIDADRFPELSAVLATGVMSRADEPGDEFHFGLDRILDGVQALVRDRAAEQGR